MISSLQKRLCRAKSPIFDVADPRYYADLEKQREVYLSERKKFRHMTRELRVNNPLVEDVTFDPEVFTRKYWERLRKKPEFLNTSAQIFWKDYDAFVEEFGLAPSKKCKLTRLPYFKHWTKLTTYWEN